MKKKYTGSVYIGVVGPEDENGVCRDSVINIARRSGDALPLSIRGTKGYENRQQHFNNFIKSKHDFLLLLDSDMVFPEGTLERLRSHELPYVSGLYMRRTYDPPAPIWFKPFRGQWPMEPWLDPIDAEKLHPIGASGWGCILIHREVIEAVRGLLNGEWDVLEDDMDLWPYDLERLCGALNGLKELVDQDPPAKTLRAALKTHVEALTAQVRPLRANRTVVGSDIRYPFFALQAGYQLVGDPVVRPGHILNYPISAGDYDSLAPDFLDPVRKNVKRAVSAERRTIADALGRLK